MSKPKFHVYSVIERKEEKPYWHKIGAAWPTKGDGLRIDLNSLPLTGNLMLMPPPREEELVDASVPQGLFTPDPAASGAKCMQKQD